jgi:uncharacterized protein (DUF58 family)
MVSSTSSRAFPLVPRYRLTGLPFGSARSTRRGRGSDLAGFRAYVPGDPISTIDWRASARLSAARGDDEFIVRERFADDAPYVVAVVDRRPSMSLYPDWSPWLAKPAAARVATEAIVASALAARGAVGYLDWASRPDGSDGPFWISPRGRSPVELIEDRTRTAAFDAGRGSLGLAIEYLARSTASHGAGTFVFVVSDFLEPLPRELWLVGTARRWELVPVVIQDPTWEQSFPSIGPVAVPIADPQDGTVLEVRFRRSEARAERERRERARSELLTMLASLGLDPVLLDRSEPDSVQRAFLDWADRRRRALRLQR